MQSLVTDMIYLIEHEIKDNTNAIITASSLHTIFKLTIHEFVNSGLLPKNELLNKWF